MREVGAFMAEFKEALAYVIDPHAWHRQYLWRRAEKFADRPAMYQAGD